MISRRPSQLIQKMNLVIFEKLGVDTGSQVAVKLAQIILAQHLSLQQEALSRR